jgi:hypothetical protein
MMRVSVFILTIPVALVAQQTQLGEKLVSDNDSPLATLSTDGWLGRPMLRSPSVIPVGPMSRTSVPEERIRK